MARTFKYLGEVPTVVLSSPLLRALQTAEILVATMGLDVCVELRREIVDGDMRPLIEQLRSSKAEAVLLVGHEPSLSSLTRDLVGDNGWPCMIAKGMVIAIEFPDDGPGKVLFFMGTKRLVPELF